MVPLICLLKSNQWKWSEITHHQSSKQIGEKENVKREDASSEVIKWSAAQPWSDIWYWTSERNKKKSDEITEEMRNKWNERVLPAQNSSWSWSLKWVVLVRSAVSLRVVAIHLVVPKAAETLANSWESKLKQSDGVTPKIGTSLVPWCSWQFASDDAYHGQRSNGVVAVFVVYLILRFQEPSGSISRPTGFSLQLSSIRMVLPLK